MADKDSELDLLTRRSQELKAELKAEQEPFLDDHADVPAGSRASRDKAPVYVKKRKTNETEVLDDDSGTDSDPPHMRAPLAK